MSGIEAATGDHMRKDKPLRSEMGWSSRDRITVRGFDLTKDLLGKIDLGGHGVARDHRTPS